MPRSKEWMRLWIGVAILIAVLAAVNIGWISVNPLRLAQAAAYIIGGMGVLYFAYYFIFADLDREERKRGVVLVVLFCGCALFFSGFEQAGSSMNLFAERYTDRTIGWLHFVIPTGWFQSLNSIFIVLFAPFFAWMWIALARRNLNPSAPAKFALGVMLMGSGFLVMAAAATIVAHGSQVLPYWLIMTYLFHTFGELCLSPVGLSYYTKLAPKRFVGQMMGMWFLATSLGNLVAGLIAGEFDANNVAAMPGQYMHIVYFSVGVGRGAPGLEPSGEKTDGRRAMSAPAGPGSAPIGVPAAQFTLKAIILSVILTVILASANAYVGLFVGLTVATAIPAAVISMALLPLFGKTNILENNIVATGASAGSSIASGAIFTLPGAHLIASLVEL